MLLEELGGPNGRGEWITRNLPETWKWKKRESPIVVKHPWELKYPLGIDGCKMKFPMIIGERVLQNANCVNFNHFEVEVLALSIHNIYLFLIFLSQPTKPSLALSFKKANQQWLSKFFFLGGPKFRIWKNHLYICHWAVPSSVFFFSVRKKKQLMWSQKFPKNWGV